VGRAAGGPGDRLDLQRHLLALDTSVKFMVTGGVLLAAVASDAVTRTRRQSAGRA
jgi:ABC-type xylose transport system permease subunit